MSPPGGVGRSALHGLEHHMSDTGACGPTGDLTSGIVVVEDLTLTDRTPRICVRVGEEAAGRVADDVSGVVVDVVHAFFSRLNLEGSRRCTCGNRTHNHESLLAALPLSM